MYVIGITSNNALFTLCYWFMRKECYCWAMNKQKYLFSDRGITYQLIFVTDRNLALMTALSEFIRHQTPCHAVGVPAKRYRQVTDRVSSAGGIWTFCPSLEQSSTILAFEARTKESRGYFMGQTMHYLRNTWLKYEVQDFLVLCRAQST